MNKLTTTLLKVDHIEQLADGDSVLHRLNPLFKIIFCFIYIVFVLSTHYFYLLELIAYFIILIVLIILAKIPIMTVLKRSLIGLPISFCLGISNLLLMRELILFHGIMITTGALSFITLMSKTFLCLSMVFLLMATTHFDSLACELVHIKVPSLFVLQLVMTYRYIFLLVEEAQQMFEAYHLKNPSHKAIEFKDMGSFVGNLLLRSFKRSEDVFNCMKCRGFNIKQTYTHFVSFEAENYFLICMVLGLFIIIKVVVR